MKKKVNSKMKYKSNVWEVISESLKLPFNKPIVFVPTLLVAAVALVAGGLLYLGSLIFTYAQGNLASSATIWAILAVELLIGLAIVLAALYSILVLMAGYLALIKDLLQGKKADLRSMWKQGKDLWLRLLGTQLLVALVILTPAILLAAILFLLSLVITRNIIWISAYAIVAIILLGLFYVLFSLSASYLIIENKGALDAVRKSFRVAKRNYFELFGLLIIFFALSIIVNSAPIEVVASLLSWFVGIAQAIALMRFSLIKN